jgi:hypothetical protein
MDYSARTIYYDYKVYREFLMNHGLDDDSNSITAEDLEDFVHNHIDEEEYVGLLKFCHSHY